MLGNLPANYAETEKQAFDKAETFQKNKEPIPVNKNFESINLSHSVILICYEIFKALNPIKFSKKGRSLKISSKSKQSLFVKYLISLLEQKDFFLPEEKKQSMILSINNLVYRFEPNDKELRILASIVSSLSKN